MEIGLSKMFLDHWSEGAVRLFTITLPVELSRTKLNPVGGMAPYTNYSPTPVLLRFLGSFPIVNM